ncbi:MAG: ribosome silencing factor, partial [Chlamydiae bacterium]|nr:ribosome silencing factor [Chlamydiota bacterium]
MEKDELNILNTIAQTLFDKKGMNILVLDVKKISSLTDFVIIVEGNVDRHVIALAQAVYGAMKDLGHHPCHEQGIKTGDWVVLDYFQVMIHIFIPSIRDKYHLEELWR